MPQLSDFYDGDARRTNPAVRDLAARVRIPHPLSNVQYADGISRCRHSKNHQRFDYCPQELRPAPTGPHRQGSIVSRGPSGAPTIEMVCPCRKSPDDPGIMTLLTWEPTPGGLSVDAAVQCPECQGHFRVIAGPK